MKELLRMFKDRNDVYILVEPMADMPKITLLQSA